MILHEPGSPRAGLEASPEPPGPEPLSLDEAEVRRILRQEYGIAAGSTASAGSADSVCSADPADSAGASDSADSTIRLRYLDGELSTVCRVETGRAPLVFKAVAASAVSPESFIWQGEVQAALAERALPVAAILPVRSSGALTARCRAGTHGGQEILVQVSSWLEGAPLSEGLPDDALLSELGRTAARIRLALDGVPPAPVRVSHTWELSRSRRSIEEALPGIGDPAVAALVREAAARFAAEVEPVLPVLPRAVVHHDLHDSNVLVGTGTTADGARGRGPRVTGVLDFGDMVEGLRVADLVVPAAYASRHYQDPAHALRAVTRAWTELAPLTEAERRVLLPAATARIGVNAAVWAARAAGPRGGYARDRSARSRGALERLLAVDPDAFLASLP